MNGHYSPGLVALSIVLAVLASYAALALAARVTATRGRFRAAWLVGGSLAMGVGIWSMHFVGMLAFHLPVPMAYDVGTVALSAGVAVLASALALYVASRASVGWAAIVLGGTVMGGAIAGMHYIGMAGLLVPASLSWSAGRVVASVAIAVGASMAALALALRFRGDEAGNALWPRVGSSLLMGGAIAGMHYMAMSATRFGPSLGAMKIPQEYVLRTAGLGSGVAVAAAAVLGCVILATLADRRRRARNAETEAIRRSEDRFRSLVQASTQIVWTCHASGDFVDEQAGWAEFTGMAPDEYLGAGWLRAVHPDDRERTADAWRNAVRDRGVYVCDYRLRRHDGAWRITQARGVPVLESDGKVREWVGANTDVTEQRRAEEAREHLAEASRVLASSLDYETTLRAVARLAVPGLADWCAVDLVDETGRISRVAVEHTDPDRVKIAEEIQRRFPDDPDSPRGVPQVVRSGHPEWVAEIPDAMLEEAGLDPDHLALLRRLGLRSYVIVPLLARHRVLGAITLVHAENARRYTAEDVKVAEELARRAAVAIDNARLFRETEEHRSQLEQQAGELEEAQAEMEMAHDELQHANDELQARTAEAERARAAADEANEAKSAFLATMSHELRTPLNAIGGYGELIEMGIHGPVTEAQHLALGKIRRNQLHLLGLINDVLNFAKIEAGHVQYDIRPIPVDETLATLEALVEPQLRARNLHYRYRPGDAAVLARADRERVEQIVLNLLTNAIKFTDPGGRVTLEWEAGRDTVAIRVTDTGRGIPNDKLAAIFEPFVQVDPALTRSSEGTGLGLAISRDLARAMGGDLSVWSRVGEGSVFTLTLPLAAGRAEPAPALEQAAD
ncbi:MAG TPA: MHYT domain-containing protein [Longimicrobium sp.]|nr:MHYT domain-containing protein [Longimicrobium sp.]